MYYIYNVLLNKNDICAHARIDEFKTRYYTREEYGLEGLKMLKNLKNQLIRVSDELICRKCQEKSSIEEAAQIIISLLNNNNVLLFRDGTGRDIPRKIRKCLREAGLYYEVGKLIPLENH